MVKVQVRIHRSCLVVWGFFLKPDNWLSWYGDSIQAVSPAWQQGASIVWNNDGSQSQLTTFITQQELSLSDQSLTTTFRFTALSLNETLIEAEDALLGAAAFAEGEAEHKQQLTACLNKLKEVIETPPAMRKNRWQF